MRIAVIGEPGAWSTQRLAAAVAAAGAEVEVVDLVRCSLHLPEGALLHAGRALPRLDGAIVKKIGDASGWAIRERIHLLRWLESRGTPVLSAPDRLELAVDRSRMTLELARAGLPVPETVITDDVDAALAATERMGTVVLKPLYTSKGRGMRRLEPGVDAREALESHRAAGLGPFYLQAFVKHPGRDLGVAVLGGRVLGAYWRIAGAEQWMTTILSGGRYERAEPPAVAIALAERAARHFGLAFTGVDLVEQPDGSFALFEVSAFGGFRGLEMACGIDAATAYARHALDHFAAAVPAPAR